MTDLLWPLREVLLSRLVARAQRGDRDAFRDLYRELHEPVWRFVRRRTRSDSEAEEIVGQVFFVLLEKLQKVDRSRGVRGYVLAIARNALVDGARRTAKLEPESAAEAIPDPASGALDQLVATQDAQQLRERLRSLPPQTQELLMLRFGDELRFAEIAELTGLGEAAVRQRVSRAVRELRQAWHTDVPKGRVAHEP